MDDARLTRMEAKLDRLADAMTSLVRVEERITTIFSRLNTIDTSAMEMGRRVMTLEKTSEGRGHAIRFAERVFWIVLTAAVGAGFVWMRGV